MGKRGKQNWSKAKLPVGTIRKRRKRCNGKWIELRFLKVHDGLPRHTQWKTLARATWEAAGELIKLYHRLDPQMSRENRYGRKRRDAIAQHNRERSYVMRATGWLPSRWYAVDHQNREVLNRPQRSRRRLAAEFGLQVAINGHISRRRLQSLTVDLVRGGELHDPRFRGFRRVDRLSAFSEEAAA